MLSLHSRACSISSDIRLLAEHGFPAALKARTRGLHGLAVIALAVRPLLPEPLGQAGHGAGQGEAQRRRAVLRAQGQAGRPSKALTLAQAEAVLKAAEGTSMHASIVVSPC